MKTVFSGTHRVDRRLVVRVAVVFVGTDKRLLSDLFPNQDTSEGIVNVGEIYCVGEWRTSQAFAGVFNQEHIRDVDLDYVKAQITSLISGVSESEMLSRLENAKNISL